MFAIKTKITRCWPLKPAEYQNLNQVSDNTVHHRREMLEIKRSILVKLSRRLKRERSFCS